MPGAALQRRTWQQKACKKERSSLGMNPGSCSPPVGSCSPPVGNCPWGTRPQNCIPGPPLYSLCYGIRFQGSWWHQKQLAAHSKQCPVHQETVGTEVLVLGPGTRTVGPFLGGGQSKHQRSDQRVLSCGVAWRVHRKSLQGLHSLGLPSRRK